MMNTIIIIFAAFFAFCILLFFALLCLISYAIIYDIVTDFYYEMRSRFKEKEK